MISNAFVRFLIVGAANTLLGYGVIIFLSVHVGASPILANICGYAVGGACGYILHRGFTFSSRQMHMSAVPRFALTWALCYLLNVVVLLVCLNSLKLPAALSQALSVCVYTLAFYVVSRNFTFRT
jgi:putative flippase GtrA